MLYRYTRPQAEERVDQPGEVKEHSWPIMNPAQLHSMKDAVRRKVHSPAWNQTYREQLLVGINGLSMRLRCSINLLLLLAQVSSPMGRRQG